MHQGWVQNKEVKHGKSIRNPIPRLSWAGSQAEVNGNACWLPPIKGP